MAARHPPRLDDRIVRPRWGGLSRCWRQVAARAPDGALRFRMSLEPEPGDSGDAVALGGVAVTAELPTAAGRVPVPRSPFLRLRRRRTNGTASAWDARHPIPSELHNLDEVV